MKEEARPLSEYFGEDLSGPLAISVEGAGDGSTDGSTRKEVVRHRLLDKVVKEQPDKTVRPVWSWPIRDTLTSAWLLSFPGPHSGLSTPVFREGLAMILCLPSPACMHRVGERVGESRVDMFGNNVLCAALPGDGWRIRHDQIKSELMRLMKWAGMVVTCEVWGLFNI